MITSDINTLPDQFFQPALSTQANGHASGYFSNRLGLLVTGMEDIAQCIHIILTTPKGSDPHRPLFGSNLDRYIDYPIDSARPHIVREVIDALRAWEPRIEVVKVTVELADVAALACVVEWKFANGTVDEKFATRLLLAEEMGR